MSYASITSRMSEIEGRLSALSPQQQTPSGFDQALLQATNRFSSSPQTLNTPVKNGINRFPANGPFTTVDGADAASAAGKSRIAPGGKLTPELQRLFDQAAQKHKVPVALLKAVARAESGFRADASSPAGAQGIMQLMPATARGLGVTNSFDVAQNINGGAKYLRGQLERYKGDARLALAAYNAGPGAVAKHGGVPPYPETQRYIEKVLGYAREFGLSMSTGLLNSRIAS